MSYRVTTVCHICDATEHRVMGDDEDIPKHVCRATTVGEDLVTL